MTDIPELLAQIDELPPDGLEAVYRHVVQRRQAAYWLVPGENLRAIRDLMQPVYEASGLSDEEIDELIDEAVKEVRRERQTDRRD